MSVLQALLNSHYSYQIGQLSCQLRSAITCLVFKKSLLVSTVDMTLFSSGERLLACNGLLTGAPEVSTGHMRYPCLCTPSIYHQYLQVFQ